MDAVWIPLASVCISTTLYLLLIVQENSTTYCTRCMTRQCFRRRQVALRRARPRTYDSCAHINRILPRQSRAWCCKIQNATVSPTSVNSPAAVGDAMSRSCGVGQRWHVCATDCDASWSDNITTGHPQQRQRSQLYSPTRPYVPDGTAIAISVGQRALPRAGTVVSTAEHKS